MVTTEDARRAGMCGAASKPVRKGKPDSYLLCTNDDGHEQPAHTACDGNGRVLARWTSQTSVVEVWLPDGSWHLA